MPEEQLIFSVPENLTLQDLKNWLLEKRPVEESEPAEIQRVFFDTFDWRLFNSGYVLEISAQKPGYLLTWRELGGGKILIQTAIRQIPRFARDLVAPGLRKRLGDLLSGRTLLPKVSVNSVTRELRVINNENKTLMRIEIRHDRAVVPHSTNFFKLPEAVYLYPLRGFEKIAEKVLRQLTRRGKLRPIQEDPLVSALGALGIDASSYTNSPAFNFDPKQPAYEALCDVLNRHRLIMEENLAGACQDKDPEFLHDFLHAARRSQCLLHHYHSVFPSKLINIIRQDFDWLEKITAPVRSLDIYLGLFDEFVTRVDANHRVALEPLRHFLEAEKLKEHRLMRVPLESPRYRRTMNAWKDILNSKTLPSDMPEDASKPIIEIASKGIYSIYLELIGKGSDITGPENPDALLELQIIEKRLGYEMETFRNLYPEEEIAPALAALRQLQDNLNTFQNLHLQHGSLLDYSKKMQQQIRTMPVWLEAIELLAADREREEHKMQVEFQARYNQLARKNMRKRFRALFSPS
ncbi:MAG: CHAD domain-containing protein [Gammaproteobacteria bacterium]|nr:CHAD domain-containing protein [Gammaproteobacteria bacterium]